MLRTLSDSLAMFCSPLDRHDNKHAADYEIHFYNYLQMCKHSSALQGATDYTLHVACTGTHLHLYIHKFRCTHSKSCYMYNVHLYKDTSLFQNAGSGSKCHGELGTRPRVHTHEHSLSTLKYHEIPYTEDLELDMQNSSWIRTPPPVDFRALSPSMQR